MKRNVKEETLKLGNWCYQQLIPNVNDAYPDVNITDREAPAMSLNTTAGFKHHKLRECFQPPPEITALRNKG